MSLSVTAQVLYVIASLAKDELITAREKCLLKGLLLRRDERIVHIATDRSAQSTNFADVASLLHGLAVEEARERFDVLCEAFPRDVCKELAAEGRRAQGLGDATQALIYNEIEFSPFIRILEQLKMKRGAKFVDLGCGVGKALFAAGMLFDFSELHGYEVLRTLVEAGERIRDTYSMISSAMRELSEDNPPVTFHAESIEYADWSFADVVFVNASCFDDDLVRAINMKVAKLRVGAFVITVTKPSVTPALKMVSSGTYRMGDSTVTVYIQQRVRRTPTAAEPAPMSPNSVATAQQAAKTMADLSSPQGESLLAAKSRRARAQRAAGAAPAVPAPEETGFRPDRSFGASGRPRPGASALSREAARGSPPSGGSRGSRGRSIGAGSGAGADVSPSRRVEAEKVLSGSGSDDGDIPVAQLRLKASVAVEARGEVPSSPQGDLLLARKMQQQQQKRSPGMRDRPGSARARLSADDSQDAGGIPVRRRMPPSMSSSLRYEMAGETPSSPQGDVLLARKAQFQHSHPPQPRFYS